MTEPRLGIARSLWWWWWFVTWTIVYGLLALPLLLLAAPFAPVRHAAARAANRLWARVVMRVAFGPRYFAVAGLDRLPPADAPHVVVANHQSLIDVLVTHCLPRPLSWVVKQSVFSVPIFGFFMWAEGNLGLRVGDADSGAALRRRAAAALRSGTWVLVYPEGTRTPDGEVHRFRRGAFEIAREAGVGIVPIAIEGSGRVLPKHGWRGGSTRWPQPVSVEVLEPVGAAEVAAADPAELSARIRARIIEAVHGARHRHDGPDAAPPARDGAARAA